jgi:hypothetical protein
MEQPPASFCPLEGSWCMKQWISTWVDYALQIGYVEDRLKQYRSERLEMRLSWRCRILIRRQLQRQGRPINGPEQPEYQSWCMIASQLVITGGNMVLRVTNARVLWWGKWDHLWSFGILLRGGTICNAAWMSWRHGSRPISCGQSIKKEYTFWGLCSNK